MTLIFRQRTAPCNVACSFGIMTVNSPSGSTLQCDTWPWDNMPLNSPKRPHIVLPLWWIKMNIYWNSTSGFDFDHITAVDCTSRRNFIQIGPPSAEKNDSCPFSRWRISAILDFMDQITRSLKSLCTTSYRSSIKNMPLNCLVFEKITFFCILATNRQTNRWTPPMH